jgi:1-acyl-sn-glycerol-3-phosphate acyltransferase
MRRAMIRRIARLSRTVRTGLAFSVFGAGAVLVAGVGFPVLRLLAGSRERGERRAQRLVHLSFRAFVALMSALGLIRVTRSGLERLRQGPPAVVVANHPTLIDVVLLIAAMPQADCVVKQAAWRNPILRGVVRGAGYLPNRQGTALVEDCVSRVRRGRWLLLFPEGTRSPRGCLGVFHRGAAHIALQAGCEVLPVVITCSPPTLGKGEPWYQVPDRRVDISIAVQAPQRLVPAGTTETRAAREWTSDLRALYEARLAAAGSGA